MNTLPTSHTAAQIAFVFNDVGNYQQLLSAFDPGVEVHVLDAGQDGLAQIAAVLAGRSGIAGVHVIGHGAPGSLKLGTVTLDNGNLGAYGDLLGRIGGALAPDGDILLYGCAVGADAIGAQFVGQLAQATGADVAASTGLTGGVQLGGDWTLEYRTGAVTADGAFDASAVRSLDTLLAPSVKDVTDTMNKGAGNFVPGFTLTTAASVLGDPDAAISGIYLNTGDNASFTVTADGTSVGVFDLTGITFVKYAPASFTHYEITITGYKAGGGTATAKIDFATNSLTPTIPDDFSDMTGLTSFDVTIADVSAEQAGGAWDITLDAFTVNNVVAPAPGTPDLTAGTDAGTNNTDNITSASAVAFTGTGAEGASVTAFIDKNNNGAYDAGTDIAGSATVAGGSWTVSGLSTSGLADGTYKVYAQQTISGATSGLSSALNITLDRTAPTLNISSSKSTLKVGETSVITFTFSEDPGATFDAGDIAVTGGTLSGLTTTGMVRTATFTPNANTNASTASITVAAGAYTDTAGNNGGAGSTPALSFDTKAPTLTITSDKTALKAGDTATITFTFSEDPGASFASGDIVVTGGTLGAISGTGTTRTATFTPNANTNAGTASVTVAANTYTDGAGNNGGSGAAPGITFDTLAPTVTISSSKAALKAGETATITFTFSEDPGASFAWDGTSGDVVVTGGTLGAISGTGTTRTATFTPSANTNVGSASITIASGAYTDGAGNSGAAGTTPGISFDTKAPTVTISSDRPALGSGETATITFTFSEDPGASFSWDGSSGDVAVSGGTLGAISGSGTTRTAVFTAGAGSSASISVTANSYTDAAGNTGAGSGALTMSLDSTPPDAPSTPQLAAGSDTGTSSSDNLTKLATPTLSGTAEAGSTVKLYDGATEIGSGTADGAGNWSITTSTLAAGAHSITARATDAAGNTGAASAALAVTVDATAPTLSISSDKSALKAGETATITFTFSEDPGSTFSWDGTSGDVVVSGGTLGAISGTGNSRTATFTPSENLNGGTASITVASGSYTDAAGNNGGAGTTPTLNFDTKAPTVTITSSASALKAGDTATITFTFSEDPGASFAWDGASGDVTVTGGTLGAISGTGTTRTAVFTPATNTNGGSASITIASGAYADAAGNGGGAGVTPSITFDTLAPGAPSTPVLDTSSDTGTSSSDNLTKLATPTLSGTAEAGSTVKLYDGITEIGSGTADGAGNWSITTSTLAAGSHSIRAAATDAAGNTGAASAALAVTVDATAPTLTISSDKPSLKSGETATITFTFSEDPGSTFSWDGTSGDVVVSGGTLGPISGTGNSRTATFTPSENLNGGTASITVASGSYTDAAGNNGGAGTTPTLNFDTKAPTVTITSSASALKAGDTATITFTFSEDPGATFAWDGASGDVTVTGGTLGAIAGTGTTRTAVFTPDANTNGGSASITIASGAYADAAGNGGGAGATPSITFDTLAPNAPSAPVLDASSDTGTSSSDDLTKLATPTLSGTAEAGSTVKLYDGVTEIGSGTADGAGHWSITTSTLAAGSHSIRAAATDAAGNTGAASAALAVTVDTAAPTLSISSDKASLKSGETATITFTFSEDPGSTFSWNGSSGDVVVSGGTLGAISGTGNSRTATFTPSENLNGGTASITVASGSYTDAAGNNGGAGTTPTLNFDTKAPTVTITSSASALKAGDTATITFTFSEDPGATFAWDGTSGDVTVTGGTLGAISGTGTTRTAVFTPSANTNAGSASITIASGTYSDAAGNGGGAGATPSITFDTLAPAAPPAPVLDPASDLGISGSDAITSDATPTFTGTAEVGATIKLYDGATLVGTGTASDGTWSITTSALAAGTHAITAIATDTAGNQGSASIATSVVVDTAAPTLAISSDKSALKAGETATITFTFSEDPGTTFSDGDISVSGGTLGTLSGTGTTRTAVFTPVAGSQGAASITVASGLYTDAAGNAGGAGTTPALSIDTLAPTVSISSSASALKAGETATITFTFSEDPGASFAWDGSSGDVVVSGGTLGAIAGTGTTRVAVFTPTPGTNGGAASIGVAGGSYADAAGNPGAAASALAIAFDTLAPSAPSTPDLAAGSDSGLSDSDNVTTSTTPVFSGTAEAGATIKLYDGVTLVGTGTATGGNWTITTSALAAGDHVITAVATDAAGNTGPASAAATVTVDLAAPGLAITSSAAALKAGESATLTFTFSEDPGASFTRDDITVTGGTLGALSGTGTTRTAVFTPTANAAGNASISVAGGSYSDMAGNAGTAAAAPAIAFDTEAPTLTITADRTALKAGQAATITFTFSEDPGASFTGGDISVSGGTLGALSGSGTTRTAVFTPAVDTNAGTASITVAGGSYADAAGNAGAAGASPSLTFDTLAPSAPSAPDLAAASDSGASGTDNTTSATSLAFSGTAEAGALVTLYDGASAIGTATAGGDGSWNVVAAGLAEGTHTLSARATDGAGNTGAASGSLSVVVDRTAPALAIASDKTALKAGDTATVTFTFSEDPGTSFDAGDIQVSGGSLGALSGTGTTRTAVFTPTAGGSGTASITIAGSAYADAAGNGGAAAMLALDFDTLAPTVSVSTDSAALKAGQAAAITFTFSEDPGASFTSADIAVSNGTLGPLSGSGAVRTAVFTPANGVEGSASISVAAGSYADAAGNTGSAGAVTLAIDTLAPAAPSVPDLAAASDRGVSDSDNLTSSATPVFTGTAENGATVRLYDGDVLVGTGTATGGAWTITAAALADGVHALKAVATDASGNSGAASGVLALTIDTAAPTLAISSDKTALKAGETATITFTFSEDPGTSFSAADITVSGGSLSALSGTGTVRSAVFTPAADTDAATASISVAAGSYADAAGNDGAAAAAAPLAYDTKAPAALLAPKLAPSSDSGASANDGVTNAASLVFGGAAEEGTVVTLVNATTGAVLGTSTVTAGAWSVAVNGAPEGALGVAAYAQDAAGNQGALSPAALVTIDRTAPAAPSVSAAEGARMHVSGLAAGATWEYSSDGGAHWNTGAGTDFLLAGDGSYTVMVRQLDLAGNVSPASAPLSVQLDTSAPVSQVALSDTSLTKGETATVTITFSEAVTGFDLADISAGNATLSQLATSDGGRTWSALLTPATGVVSSTNTVTVDNGGVRDMAGNPGVGSSSSPNYAVQTSGLGATIDISDTSLAAGETALVTIVFSEAVRGFTLADLAVENAKLSKLASIDGGRTWTALLTPSSSVSDASNHVVLDNAGVTGASGVRGEGTTVSANYVVNTVRPTAAISLADHVLAPGGSTTVTIRFSEPVTGFDSADLAVTAGTLSGVASSDGGLTWTARLTVDNGGKSAQPGFVSVDMAGLRNVAGNTGVGTVAVQFVQAPANAQLGTVDGMTVISQSVPDPVTGRVEQVLTIPEVTNGRQEDHHTPNGALADIPIGTAPAPGGGVLTASLPVGAGLQVAGPSAPLNGADGLQDLIRRIESTTTPGSATQADMSGHGQDFLASLGSGTLIESKTVVPSVAPGATLGQPIVISGAAPNPGSPGAPVVGLVIDGSGLPAGSTLQLDNVEFAAVTGNLRLIGGAGSNYVVGDGASQTIYLGAEDDVLSGGGGNDFIGSAGGNDRLDGGEGDDLVAGGIGNDLVIGGSGNDVVLGGRSVAGNWQFYLSGGVLSARHDGAVFSASGSETVRAGELDAGLPELRFLQADPQKVLDVALLYASLDRTPDLAGLSFWSQSGISLKQVAAGMLASAEFDGGALGQTSDAVFVQGMYEHVLGRTPSAADVEFWTGRLAGGSAATATRADVLMAVALSDEHRKQVLGPDGYLVGQGSQPRETAWFSGSGDDKLDGGAGNDLLVGGDGFDTALYAGGRSDYRVLLGADHGARVLDTASGDIDTLLGVEAAQFKDGAIDLTFFSADPAQLGRIGMLYQAVLDRAADAAGLKWWLSLGMAPSQLALAFTASPEFQARFGTMGDAAFVQALYANSGLDAGAAGGMQSWQAYLGQHTRAELVAAWITQDDVVHAQFGTHGLWLV